MGIATGYVIIIEHQDGLVSIYKHNGLLSKNQGDLVKAGEVIGAVGGTIGLFTGFHLHLILMEMMSYLAGFTFKMMKKVASYGGKSNKVKKVHPQKNLQIANDTKDQKNGTSNIKIIDLEEGTSNRGTQKARKRTGNDARSK